MNWRLPLRNFTLHAASAGLLAVAGAMIGVPLLSSHPLAALLLSVSAVSLLILFANKPVRRLLQPVIDHVLFSDEFAYLEILGTLPNDLLEFTNLREMLEFLIARLTEVAKLERVRVFMHDPGHQSYAEMVFRGSGRGGTKAADRAAKLPEDGALVQWLKEEGRLWTIEELRQFPKFMSTNGLTDLQERGGAAFFPIYT